MKVITNVTLHHRDKPEAKKRELPPGEHELPDAVAQSLIKRGHAKLPEKAKADAAAEEKAKSGTVQVRGTAKAPQK